MRLNELMSTNVVTVEMTQAASTAWSRMRQNRIRHLVVTDNGRLAGVISDRDLGGERGAELRKGRTVQDLMSPRVVSAEPQITLRQAANIMRGRMIGSLPVLDGDRLVGIVTATDVLDELGRGSTGPKRLDERGPMRATPPSRRPPSSPKVVRRRSSSVPRGRARHRQPHSPARAPLPGQVPKSVKRTETGTWQVPAHIRTKVGGLGPDDMRYIRRKLGNRLGKFSGSIERVSVRTEDANGPRGGIDQQVRIKVVLSGLPSVVFESRDASLNAAVDRAISGVERAVRRTLQRRRMKPLISKRAATV
jgi:CBS domain-containing protein